MNLSKEEAEEIRILANCAKFYSDEKRICKKYLLLSAIAIASSLSILVYIYIDSGSCFKYYKNGLIFSFISGFLLMWGISVLSQMRANKFTTHFVDKAAIQSRIDELGGIDSIPRDRYTLIKNVFLWFIIAFVLTLVFKYVQKL